MSDTIGPVAPKRGRPRSDTHADESKRIRLKPVVFYRWMTVKESLGYQTHTCSQLAEFLLNLVEQQQPAQTVYRLLVISKSIIYIVYISSFYILSMIDKC